MDGEDIVYLAPELLLDQGWSRPFFYDSYNNVLSDVLLANQPAFATTYNECINPAEPRRSIITDITGVELHDVPSNQIFIQNGAKYYIHRR